jgi:hypothetical protein
VFDLSRCIDLSVNTDEAAEPDDPERAKPFDIVGGESA